MSNIYTLCPEDNKSIYKKHVRLAIESAENVVRIRVQLEKKDIIYQEKDEVEADICRNVCSKNLKKLALLFRSKHSVSMLLKATDYILMLLVYELDIIKSYNVK
jgi:hypothetical protein